METFGPISEFTSSLL